MTVAFESKRGVRKRGIFLMVNFWSRFSSTSQTVLGAIISHTSNCIIKLAFINGPIEVSTGTFCDFHFLS